MNIFRTALGIVWLVLMVISVRAVQQLGLDGMNIFISDFSQPWRAQFYTDFSIHLVLIVLWIIYREPNRWVGIVCAALAGMLGSVFTLAYLFIATFRSDGDFRKLLLGRHISN